MSNATAISLYEKEIMGNSQFQSIMRVIFYILKETNDMDKTIKILLGLLGEATQE
jgi:hypothetical protein